MWFDVFYIFKTIIIDVNCLDLNRFYSWTFAHIFRGA